MKTSSAAPSVPDSSDILIIYGSLKPHERNPGKMTFTTTSGLLPAGIAVYVQRGPNGVGLEMRYIQLSCKGLRLKAKDASQIDYCQLPKELGIFSPSSFDETRPTTACDVGKMSVVTTASDFGGIGGLIEVCRDCAPGVRILNESAGTCVGNDRRWIGTTVVSRRGRGRTTEGSGAIGSSALA